ncbi:MAG TPA: APC family permease [Candidatus Limnocylindrales bacterium]|nr:APC family permease [Candidatus Limnocylindrales bacterium]
MTTSAGPTDAGPRLRRTLTLWNLIVIGMVIIQPIAPMGIYGVINNAAGGHVVTTILIALVAMFFTAISYGKMARVYPSAGSAYTYVGQEIHTGLGYLTGWAMVMDYILNPLICTIICSKLTQNILPGIPYWALAIFYAGFFSLLNLGGVKTSARINEVLAAGMTVVVIIFFAFVIRFVLGYHQRGPAFFTEPFYNPATFNLSAIGRGTSLAVLTYIGFDGISTFSEEVENPRRNIMLATVLVCVVAGVLSAAEVYAAQLVWGSKPFAVDKVESAFPIVAQQIGGFFLFHLLNFTVLIANIGSGIASQLAAARLLYGMGRNDAIPKSFFGKIEEKRRIPANNVMIIGAVALVGAFLITYERGAEMLNFGAFIAFMGVNAAAFVHYYLRSTEKKIGNLLMPLIGFVVCGVIWWSLSPPAKIAGTIWLALGVAYGVWKTSGFRKEMSFEVPPEE